MMDCRSVMRCGAARTIANVNDAPECTVLPQLYTRPAKVLLVRWAGVAGAMKQVRFHADVIQWIETFDAIATVDRLK